MGYTQWGKRKQAYLAFGIWLAFGDVFVATAGGESNCARLRTRRGVRAICILVASFDYFDMLGDGTGWNEDVSTSAINIDSSCM